MTPKPKLLSAALLALAVTCVLPPCQERGSESGSDAAPGTVLPQPAADALKLEKAGFDDAFIVERLGSAPAVELTTDQVVYLKSQGVSQQVILRLIHGAAAPSKDSTKSAAQAPAAEANPVPPAPSAEETHPALDPYEPLLAIYSGTWTTQLDSGSNGTPRSLELTSTRDPATGAVTVDRVLATKGVRSLLTRSTIVWDPKDRLFRLTSVGRGGEKGQSVLHAEGNSLVSEGTLEAQGGFLEMTRGMVTLRSPGGLTMTDRLLYKGEWLFAASLSMMRSVDGDASGQTIRSLPQGDVFENPKLVKVVRPKLPPDLHPQGSSSVLVEFIVNTDGSVTEAEALGNPSSGLDEAALDAVSGWKFVPAKQNGAAIRSVQILPVIFSAHSDSK